MTNPMDEQGNALAPGDLVVILDGQVHIYAIVADVKLPGLIAPATASAKQPAGMEMAGVVMLQPLPISKIFIDKAPKIPDVIKVEKPPQFIDAQRKAKDMTH